MLKSDSDHILEPFDASSYKVGIVIAQFNSEITEQLLESALEELKHYQVEIPRIVKVAGAIEIPLILQHLAETHKYDALVALGAVIRGETTHYDYVCQIVSSGVLRVQLDHKIPIGFGVLTCKNIAQCQARLDIGASSVAAALQSARVLRRLNR